MTEEKKVIKIFKSFILGKCRCGCGTDIPIKKKDKNILQEYAYQHHHRGKYGINSCNYRGGIMVDKSRGYATIVRRHHPYRDNRNRVYLHRYLKELDLGYYITKEYDVDHVNGDKRDNSPENLQILLKADHTRKHNPVLDRTKTKCSICDSNKTNKATGGVGFKWYKINEEYICDKCYMKKYRERNSI